MASSKPLLMNRLFATIGLAAARVAKRRIPEPEEIHLSGFG
jgi:hypothetical protein